MTADQMLKDMRENGWVINMRLCKDGCHITLAGRLDIDLPTYQGSHKSLNVATLRAWEWCQQTDDMFPCDRCGECFTELQDVGAFEGGQMCGPCLVSELNERHEDARK